MATSRRSTAAAQHPHTAPAAAPSHRQLRPPGLTASAGPPPPAAGCPLEAALRRGPQPLRGGWHRRRRRRGQQPRGRQRLRGQQQRPVPPPPLPPGRPPAGRWRSSMTGTCSRRPGALPGSHAITMRLLARQGMGRHNTALTTCPSASRPAGATQSSNSSRIMQTLW